jgi:hypothetical protein
MCERGEMSQRLKGLTTGLQVIHEALVDYDAETDSFAAARARGDRAIAPIMGMLREIDSLREELQLPPDPNQPPEELCACMACRAWVRAAGGPR